MSTKTTKRSRAASSAATESGEAPVSTSAACTSSDAAQGEPVVTLFSNSTVKDAAALKDTLLQVLDAPSGVTIDAKSVERIDTAIVQLLCAFVRDRAAHNRAVTWSGTPQVVFDAARLLGLGELLGLPGQAMEA